MTHDQVVANLEQAVGLLQRGQVAPAEALLSDVLRAYPDQPDALHYLGVAALQSGRVAQAIDLIHRSVVIQPGFAAFNNLGQALRGAARTDEALACFDRSIQLQPDHPDAYLHAARLLIARNQHEPAMRLLQRAAQVAPDHPEAHFWLGVCSAQLDYLERAAAAFRRHLELKPDHAEGFGRLATVLTRLSRHPQAVAAAERAVALAPHLADAWNNLGWCFEQSGQTDQAIGHYRRAVALNPSFVMALGNLGSLLDKQGETDEAIALFEKARAVDGRHVEVLNSLAGLYSRAGRYADALATAEAALAVRPHDASARGHRALALLSFGRYEEGFREYEWRWECKDFTTPVRQFDQPRWTGKTDPSGRTILVHSEQGFGDNIQFARYLPLLAARGANVVVEAPVALCGLMQTVPGVARVVAAGVRPPPFDLQAPLLSLPHAFGTGLQSVPAEVPYFRVPADRSAAWRQRLKLVPDRLNVGLVWRGNSKPNPRRSIPLNELAPLADENVQFVSLQVGSQGDEADSPPTGMRLLDLRQEIRDFVDAAAIIEQLDLVITIDTAAAHLAGALARPTWTLLIAAADWRWLQPPREDTPWYPTMRLFRQTRAGSWAEVVGRVAGALREHPHPAR